jgi:hypothetical protein
VAAALGAWLASHRASAGPAGPAGGSAWRQAARIEGLR